MSAVTSFHMIPIDQLAVSFTEAQLLRRKHFDKVALDELAASVKDAGVLQPILVRPSHQNGKAFEIVYGERRYLAAQLAGQEELPANVRELTDDQVLEIQLIENLQREGLHPLSEAEGYEQLQRHGHSAEEIAHKLGKSKAYIYARMKLLALGPAAREAFYRGQLTASTALLLARIATPSVQREACGKITEIEPMSYREARQYIEHNYMLRLNEAPFPTGDEDLVQKAGSCSVCPKRTGNQPELFADIKSGDVCTDPVCFKLKREAWGKQQIAVAKSSGKRIVTGPEAKKAVDQWGHLSYNSGFARLTDSCYDDGKSRTYKQLLGKSAEIILVENPKTGDVIEVIDKAAAIKQLKKAGTIEPRDRSVYGSAVTKKPKSDAAAEKIEKHLQDSLVIAICAKAPKKLPLELLREAAQHELDACAAYEPVLKAFELKSGNIGKNLNEPDLYRLLYVLLTIGDYDKGVSHLTTVAKGLGVDVKKLQADAKAAVAPATAPAKKKPKGKK